MVWLAPGNGIKLCQNRDDPLPTNKARSNEAGHEGLRFYAAILKSWPVAPQGRKLFMRFRSTNPIKTALATLIMPALMLTAAHTAAGAGPLAASTDPRFGLVNAIDAPLAAAESGASWELLTLGWNKLQPGDSSQWSPSPAIDAELSEARTSGREPVGMLISTPGWATDGKPGIGVPRGLYLPVSDANNLWASFVREAVGYYGTRGINRWVIWDSPDLVGKAQPMIITSL
jgi:hypothetical protein